MGKIGFEPDSLQLGVCGPWACSGRAFQSLIVFGKECRCESTCTFEWGNGNFSLFILLLVLRGGTFQARSVEGYGYGCRSQT